MSVKNTVTGKQEEAFSFLKDNHIKNLCATKNLGKNIRFFDKRIKKKLPKISSISNINWNNLDLVFLSLPNGEAQKIIKINYKKIII